MEIADDRNGVYAPDKETRFKTSMLESRLCVNTDVYILRKISDVNPAVVNAYADFTNIKVTFKNCVPFKIWNKQTLHKQITPKILSLWCLCRIY